MMRYWLMILVAAVFEVIWVSGLKHADQIIEWVFTLIALASSFGVLIYTAKKLPVSTVYAVFVGLGTAATVICEMIWFNEPFNWLKLGWISILLIGIMGLKLATHGHQSQERRGEGHS